MANRRTGLMAIGLALALGSTAVAAGKTDKEKVNGYLDFRDGQYLIVDGQKVATDARTKFTGGGRATSIAAIPIGYEVKAKGVRQAGGVILATEIEANRNGQGSTEKQVLAGTDQAEKAWVSAGKIVEPGPDGKETSMGKLITSGPPACHNQTSSERTTCQRERSPGLSRK